MLNELECVWMALFGDCVVPELRHNEHILNSSIASEFSSLEREGITAKTDEAKLYSLKRVLQVILDNADSELTEVGVEAVFKAREELVNVFKNVAQNQGFDETLKDAIKLVIIDALNRKVKERNPEFTTSTADFGNVNAARGYFEASGDLKDLVREIKQMDEDIKLTRHEIQQVSQPGAIPYKTQMSSTLANVNDYIYALKKEDET
ncbi:flagellar associated protein, putative [Babesia ovis]|uniref:Flagellar associated protein, putative n=1 Tax=Babesia ovis TaxID=5869 RepID=A0A9W5TAM8_BABOV|nr:flagellar associated protein, putative [Babesia ovis]